MARMRLSTKLISTYVLVGLIPLATVGFVAWWVASGSLETVSTKGADALEDASYLQLSSMRDTKVVQVENYFKERRGDMQVLAETVETLRREAVAKLTAVRDNKKRAVEILLNQALVDLRAQQARSVCTKGLPEYRKHLETGETTPEYDRYAAIIDDFIDETGYYDYFVIDRDGMCVHTRAREKDYHTNLLNGPYASSGLGRATRKALEGDVAFEDFKPYAPSGGEPAAFLAASIRENGAVLGVVALQMSLEKIQAIMDERSGLGKTGETYLIGSDYLMRSDSFLDPDNHSVLASFRNPEKGSVETAAGKAVIAGETDADVIIDYNGNPVLSAYTPVEFMGERWGLLAEIDVAEAFSPAENRDDKDSYFFAKYVSAYGYYDLFLINPDGYCFYTVAQEDDWKKNFITGKYSNSNMGRLVDTVVREKRFGFADFAPYAPSNDIPCAFVAQPIMAEGKVILVVGLQLPNSAISDMVSIGSDVDQRLESYLVGPDTLMRSDSVLNSDYSVEASFANKRKVDTEASTAALRGETGEKVVLDYNGEPVLSAYAPVDVFGVHYALLCEIDEAVAMAAKLDMQTTSDAAESTMVGWTVGIAVVAGVIVAIIAYIIAVGISKPIARIIASLTEGADQTAAASGQISTASQQLSEGATEQAAALEESSSSLEEMASMTRQNADNAGNADQMMSDARKQVEGGAVAVGNMADAMTNINDASEQIGNIINTIEEIAFQTNLLALNAAVEAARAGDAGKGFAVVADEVRNLAQRSAQAARDTADLIKTTVDRVKGGNEIVSELTSSFEEIQESSGKVAGLISEISAAGQEQAQGIDQVNNAVAQMDKVTQQNAANAEESASASEELSAQAEQLNDMVRELNDLVGGDAMNGHSSRGRPAVAHQQQPRAGGHAAALPHAGKQKSGGGGNSGETGGGKGGAGASAPAVVNPDDMIPLDDDFKDF